MTDYFKQKHVRDVAVNAFASMKTEVLKTNAGASPFELLANQAESPLPELAETDRVYIRRHQQDWRIGYVSKTEIDELRWDTISGGVHRVSSQPFIHGYVMCDRVRGEISHSCAHGEGPHRIKVLVTKKDNSKEIFDWCHGYAGPKPVRTAHK